MNTITAESIFETTVYMIDYRDPIDDGIDSPDVLGNVDNANRMAYIKKITSSIIIGTGTPSGSYGQNVDSNTSSNTYYFDTVTESFWIPTVSYSSIVSWTNITKNFIINVNGVSVNDNGDDSWFIKMKYDPNTTSSSPGIIIYDKFNQLADMRVGKIKYEYAKSISGDMMMAADDELLTNNIITRQSENSEGGLDVKSYSTGTTSNKRYFHYVPLHDYFKLYDEQGNLLKINVSNIYLNGVLFANSVSTLEDVVISDQEGFDAVFNTDLYTGGLTMITSIQQYNYIFIKPGTYHLKNYIKIFKSNVKISCAKGATIIVDMTSSDVPAYNQMLAWGGWGFDYDFRYEFFSNAWTEKQEDIDSFFTIQNASDVELNLNIDCDDIPINSIVKFENSDRFSSELNVTNMKTGSAFLSDGIRSNCKLNFIHRYGVYKPDYIFNNITGGFLSGNVETTNYSIFTNCTNYLFRGTVNGEKVYSS